MGAQPSKKNFLTDINNLRIIRYPTVDHYTLSELETISVPDEIPTSEFIVSRIHVRVCGQVGVGKSSLVAKLLNQHNDKTLGQSQTDGTSNYIEKTYKVNKIEFNVKFVLHDSDMFQNFDLMRTGFYFVVYDMTNRKSFDEAKRLITIIKNFTHNKYYDNQIITVIANKADLEPMRQVSTTEGKELASSINGRFHEISALWNSSKDVKKVIGSAIKIYIDEELKNINERKQKRFDYLEIQRTKLIKFNEMRYHTK